MGRVGGETIGRWGVMVEQRTGEPESMRAGDEKRGAQGAERLASKSRSKTKACHKFKNKTSKTERKWVWR